MLARKATIKDTEQVTDAFVVAMQDDPGWAYQFPYRQENPEDYRKYNHDLIRRCISEDYEDWTIMVIDTEDPAIGKNKVLAFSIWNLSYLNKRKHGPGYEPRSPRKDIADAGGSSRKDADPKHIAAFEKSVVEAREKYFADFVQDRIHLHFLATLPDYRRRGCASTLVRWGMDRAIDDQVPLTLIAGPLGFPLYKSLGFQVLGRQKAQVPGEEDFFMFTAMVYKPGLRG